jgi:hypothetical protein
MAQSQLNEESPEKQSGALENWASAGLGKGACCPQSGCPMCRSPWILLVLLGIIAGILAYNAWGRVREIKLNPAYQLALDRIRSSPEAAQKLGSPILDVTWWPSWNFQSEGTRAEAILTMKVAGPKATAEVYVQARRVGTEWSLTVVSLRMKDGTVLELSPARKLAGASESPRGSESSAEEPPRWNPPPE